MLKKNSILQIILLLFAQQIVAQKNIEEYTFDSPVVKAKESYYNRLSIVDAREDTASIGIIQKGAFNKKAKVVCIPPLQNQLQAIFAALINDSAKNNELVFLLQGLNFLETTYAVKEIGVLHVRGVFFAKANNKYGKLKEVDTLMVVDKKIDVTKSLLKNGSSFITSILSDAISSPPTNFNLDNVSYIINYDSLEKIKFPLYTMSMYKNGAYATFNELLYQQPSDSNINIEFYKSGHWKSIQSKNKKGKFEEVVLSKWYAFVFNNKIFLSTNIHEVYVAEKKGMDFYFRGKHFIPPSTGQQIGMGVMFGLFGLLASSTGTIEKADLKIDYKTGSFVKYLTK